MRMPACALRRGLISGIDVQVFQRELFGYRAVLREEMMDWTSMAYAMGGAGQGGSGQGAAGGLGFFAPLVIMMVIFYFLLIRPQQKRQKELKNMLASLQKGDVVLTQGGLQGKVTGLTDTVLTLEIAEKVRVKVQRAYVVSVVSKGEPEE
jgi:preprotein translocase subunit YajC